MTSKIVLSMDDKAIKRAKRIAKKKGKSLSKIVEEYFNSIPEKKSEQKSAVERIEERMTPYLTQLELPGEVDYKTLIKDWKYLDYIKHSEKI